MKTKTITLTIPKDQRLGQAIMNAYRERWFNSGREEDLQGKGFWDIWQEDEERIQEAINNCFKNDR